MLSRNGKKLLGMLIMTTLVTFAVTALSYQRSIVEIIKVLCVWGGLFLYCQACKYIDKKYLNLYMFGYLLLWIFCYGYSVTVMNSWK